MYRTTCAELLIALNLIVGGHAAIWAEEWEPLGGRVRIAGDEKIVVLVTMPDTGEKFRLDPSEDPAIARFDLRIWVRKGRLGLEDITDQVESIHWMMDVHWRSVKGDWSEHIDLPPPRPSRMTLGYSRGAYPNGDGPGEGFCEVWAEVTYKGKTYLSSDPAKVEFYVAGQNPTRAQIAAALPDDRTRAIAWQESEWSQFLSDGRPRWTRSDDEESWGLMQLNELAWYHDFEPWADVCWQWTDNVSHALWYWDYLATRFTPAQQAWSAQRRLDVRTYGYSAGEGFMREHDDDWEYFNTRKYVNDVRGWEETKPWLLP